MVLKSALAAAVCTGLLILGSPAMADEYGAGEFLGMDLPKALLSPKRLGPETEFAPFPIEARTDRKQVKTERVSYLRSPNARLSRKSPRGRRSRSARRAWCRAGWRSHAAPPAPSWRDAIRSMRRRAIREFRPGRAGPARSAAGRASPRRNSSSAASGRYVQIAADDDQGGERKGDAHNRGCNRGQPVGIQPVL